MDVPTVEGTYLTDRQAEVLSLRERGWTQREIAERIDTSVANVSSVESAARDNISRARLTLTHARLLGAAVHLQIDAGADLRDVVDRVFKAGDEAGVRIAYSDPELAAHLRTHLAAHLTDRRLTEAVIVGISADGDVATHPSAVLPNGEETGLTWID